jgi:hypothetical protein
MTSLNFQPRVPVFDANVGVGHRHDRPSPFSEANELLEEMRRRGVDRAVIYHLQGEAISAIRGNEALPGWADEAVSLQWMAGPGDDSLRQLKGFHATERVESVRLHSPEEGRVPFLDWLYGPLLEWLSAEGIPLWVSLADGSPAEIVDTLQRFPDLRVVLLGAHYMHSTMIRPMLRHLPKAYLELSRFENLGGVEALIAEVGAGRLIYGSYFPRYAMGAMLFYLHHLEIDDSDLAAICAGNLERLLRGET